jgi:hypothetical protein
MANTTQFINQGALDSAENVWCVGHDLTFYDGQNWTYYNYENSAVPNNFPYYADTRSISIDEYDTKWVGCAVSSNLSQVLVFNISSPDVNNGTSWTISDFNLTSSPNWEVPTIYASPFGDEVLAFISPLNGGGGTGATGNIGSTGGFLWSYNKITQTWTEVSPGYTWPHIFEIKVKGKDGINWEYYLATDDGIQIIPPGRLDVLELQDGTKFIPNLKKFNSYNSSLPSNFVNSLSFDEDGHVWIGSDYGLTYFDNEKFYNWTVPGNLSVSRVVSRANGHVFFRCGDPFGIPTTTNGFFHFNGDTFTSYTTSNSNLPSNLIIDILLAPDKSNKGSLTVYPNDLWIVAGNFVVLFDYVIPHVYASSKYEGTTGWNFIYYTPSATGATTDSAKLPKAERFDWVYPSWQGYENANLALNHPGMDPRNLFLTTDFKAIADGRAGNQDYWNWGQVVPYDQQIESGLIQDYSWLVGITGASQLTISSVSKYKELNVLAGYTSNSITNFGPSSNSEDQFLVSNPNPTNGTPGTQNFGFVAFYTDGGQVQGVVPFPGFSTRVLSAKPSFDSSSLIVLGAYSRYVEGGKFVWGSQYPTASDMNVTGITGPTGGPIGFSNIATPGLTASFDYPWILNGPTGATSGVYIPQPALLTSTIGYFLAEIDFELGDSVSYGDIDFSTETTASKFCLKNFRTFPGANSIYDPAGHPAGTFPTAIRKSDLSISQNSIRFTTNITGGISTLKNDYDNSNDMPGAPEFLFSSYYNSSYTSSGLLVELNPDFYLKTGAVIGMTGGGSLDNITSLPNGLTYVLSGTANDNVNFGNLGLTHATGGFSYPWLIASNYDNLGITGSFLINSSNGDSNYTTWQNTSGSFASSDVLYTTMLYTGNATLQNYNSGSLVAEGASGSVNAAIFSVSPGGKIALESNFEILPSPYEFAYNATISDVNGIRSNNSYYLAVNYEFTPGITGDGNVIIKRSVSGTYVDEFSTFPSNPNSGTQTPLKLAVAENLNVFLAGGNSGITGPTGLPYPAGNLSFVSLLESYKAPQGIDLGNIISRAGSGAWTWVDVHNSSNDLYIPMLSTVFFSNYDSSIFGKQNNRWVLTNAKTNEVLLDVKFTPYFIYTFTESGYYSLFNSVEDSFGNVYEITKPAFIKVVNQSIPAANDPNPLLVNSADYGYAPAGRGFENEAEKLEKDMLEQQILIRAQNTQPFASGLVLNNDSNSTFRGN